EACRWRSPKRYPSLAVLPPLLPALVCDGGLRRHRSRNERRRRSLLRLLETLELGRDRLDAVGDLAALRLPLALLALERGEFRQGGRGILALEPPLGVGEALLQGVPLLFQARGLGAELGDEAGGALHALRETIQIAAGDDRGFVHDRSLS